MTEFAIKTDRVQIPNGDLLIDAYLAQPEAEGTFGAIVVFQEIFGVNAHIREVTERIARQGYVAIAPALYQRLAPGFEVGYTDADVVLGREYKVQTQASELLSDTQATIDYLKTLPSVRPQFGTIGFCFGGHVAYLAATLPEIAATASFYGVGIATMCPGEEEPTIARTPQISGTLYAFFGTEDPLIPLEEVDRIEAALTQHQIPHRIFRYDGANHGFFCNARSSYNADAAADAWQHVLQLFAEKLK
ncbi:MAG: dienelactone hydrolase family protein [Cyanobacteria bacterium J055]|nr:MAG: dienelactone hydrolase family protein [Cyanobacteria bacterium J055]